MSVAVGTSLIKATKFCSTTLASVSLSLPSPTATLTPHPVSLRLDPLPRPRRSDLCVSHPNGFPSQFLHLHPRHSSVVAFAASHEESEHSDFEVEKEQDDTKSEAEESEAAWEQTLAAFKEQALKMQSVSQETYELYLQKAMVLLKETSEQLKIQAEKVKHDLSVVAKEISEEGKDYLSAAAKNSPKPVKEIVESFSSPTNDLNDVTQVRDFYLGVPYGLLLSLGGFLSFMVTGDIPAIRFGVILGGTLLALSVSSLRSYKRVGKPPPLAVKGQAVIASVILLRAIRLFFQRPSLWSFLTSVTSGAMVAFYLHRIKQDGKQRNQSTDQGMGT